MPLETKWKPKLYWPSRENWYEMVVSDYMGPSPSPYLNDYASPDEIKLAVDGLKRLRRKLH